jgi:hypothetical protein
VHFSENIVVHGYTFGNEQWAANNYGEFPTFTAAGKGGI